MIECETTQQCDHRTNSGLCGWKYAERCSVPKSKEQPANTAALDILRELVDIVQGHVENGDKLDSFTLQPAREFLSALPYGANNVAVPSASQIAEEIDTYVPHTGDYLNIHINTLHRWSRQLRHS